MPLKSVNIADIVPPNGHVQRLYCDECGEHLDLAFADYHANVSGIEIEIRSLPVLRCQTCNRDYLPDRSRFAIIEQHRRALESGLTSVKVSRKKPNENYGFTKVPFLYDADDYRYIPGLERSFDVGFLTPVFFNKEALLKYEASPTYAVKFASTTYGEIVGDGFSIPFGINKNGKVIIWLGDLAKLPESEQYYLRSENIPSDHSIASEFYDGQIECIFTEPTRENKLFALRSAFIAACVEKFKMKIGHLDDEVFSLAQGFNAPVVDSAKERRHVADTLNKIYIESLDNHALGALITKFGGDPKNLGSLKRLQLVLGAIAAGVDIPKLLLPLFVLYDLRVAYSHLTSVERAEEILKSVTDRLGVSAKAGLIEIYDRLTQELVSSFEKMTAIVDGAKT